MTDVTNELRRPAFIVDLDDTLNVCGKYYDECKQAFAAYMNVLGMPKEECYKRFTETDLERAKDSRIDFESRFPGSMVCVFKAWCQENKLEVTEEQELEVAGIGYSVYNNPFEPRPDAHNMLYELSHDYDLYLYTKGNQERQIKKILKADLDPYFKRVWITDQKTVSRLTVFMLQHELTIRTSWVLGNSPKSDILPALELGIPTHQLILIDTYQWEEDHAQLPENINKIKSLGEVVPITRRLFVEGN